MAILIRLFQIKIVANKERGASNSLIIRLEVGDCSFLSLSKSLGDKEKKATSELEISAEEINNKTTRPPATAKLTGDIANKNKEERVYILSTRSGPASN